MSTERVLSFCNIYELKIQQKASVLCLGLSGLFREQNHKYGTVCFKQLCHHLHPKVNEGTNKYPQMIIYMIRYDMI